MADRRLQIPLIFSILAALATLVLKYLAYHLTGSVGLLSDAADSIVNLLAAITALLSLYYASRPVDLNHTYGHEKVEYLSSGVEGLLILATASIIVWFAVERLFVPTDLESLDLGMAISVVAALINLAIARVLLHVGRKSESIILEADGKHLMSDVWVSAGILVGVGLVRLTTVQFFDPLIALVVAGYIAWTSFDLIWRSFNGLMDHALSKEEQNKVRAVIEDNLTADMDYHALRTRQAGSRRFADFHLLVPGEQTVHEAHAIASRIEENIKQVLPGIEVTVHIEPIEERQSYSDSALLPIEQAARQAREREKGQTKL